MNAILNERPFRAPHIFKPLLYEMYEYGHFRYFCDSNLRLELSDLKVFHESLSWQDKKADLKGELLNEGDARYVK